MIPNPISQSGESQEIDTGLYMPEQRRYLDSYGRSAAAWAFTSIFFIIITSVLLVIGGILLNHEMIYTSVGFAVLTLFSVIFSVVYRLKYRHIMNNTTA
jgi:uncharacterized Tic20 family protein